MHTPHAAADRAVFHQLAFVPVGLLLATAAQHRLAASGAPTVSVLAVDLLALAMGALLGWLGGAFATPHPVHAPLRRERRRRARPFVGAEQRSPSR